MESSTPTFVLSLVGTLTGTTGVVLSVLNYLRDRVSAIVSLQWDFTALDSNNLPTGKPMGLVSITNNGRRPLYIKLVYLEVPKRSGRGPMILTKSVEGRKLGEGDSDYVIQISNDVQEFLHQHFAAYWKGIYAVAVDNCGRKYKSKRPNVQPSWGQIEASTGRNQKPK